MRLRRRLLATIAGLSLATLGSSFFAVYVANNSVQERQLDTALLREAQEEAKEAAQAGGERLMISDRPGPQANDVGPLTKFAAIYEPDGRVVAATPTFRAGAPRFDAGARRGQPYNFYYHGQHLRGVLVAVPAAPHTTLLLAAPRSDLDGDEAFLARAMLVVFAFAFAWVLAISSWVVRRFTRGHELIAQVAREVAGGNLAARVQWPAKNDDVAQLARDVNHMISQLGALMSSHRLFIASAAHELRSPLTALYGELSHALRKSRDADSYRAAISEALDSTKRLMTLSEDLLALARLSGSAQTRFEHVDIASALQNALAAVRPEATDRGTTIEVPSAFGTVRGSANDIERLFRNLLENAVRYSPAGGTVHVDCQTGEELAFTIRNQGVVAETERNRLFEPFQRGEFASAQDQPGAGLGLAIARQIAWAHGGSIELLSALQSEVAFQVRLPLEHPS